MKINRENAGWIFVCVVLLGLLAVSVYLGLSGWYFKTEKTSVNDFQLGKTVQISLYANEANAVAFNFDGSFLSGEKLPQIIAVQNADEKDVWVRAKAFVEDGNLQTNPLSLEHTANWLYNEKDGYYYYNDILTSQNKVALCSGVYSPQQQTLQTSKDYIITFVFESIDSSIDWQQFWTKANAN